MNDEKTKYFFAGGGAFDFFKKYRIEPLHEKDENKDQPNPDTPRPGEHEADNQVSR